MQGDRSAEVVSELARAKAEPALGAGLELQSICAGYGDALVLRNVSLSVPPASVVALLGPNGAGKTTLLRVATGLLKPESGTVHLGGADVTRLAPHRRVALGLCSIPQGRGIFRSLTVRENLLMQSATGREDEAIERATTSFPVLGDRLGQNAGTLSGGQQQMLAFARAYVQSPEMVLVDEASLGLAPIIIDQVFDFLGQINREGASLLLVDQFVTRVLAMASTAYLLRGGEIVANGSPADLLELDIFREYMGA